MQRLNRTIKRMVALGAGVALLGATVTGALAQDLTNYPQPFINAITNPTARIIMITANPTISIWAFFIFL